MNELRIGYIQLTDAAVLIAAAELGFARQEGIVIRLEREASWATLRDKLALGVVDAAHILAPLAVAMTLGVAPGSPLPLIAPFALNLNGNAITVAAPLWAELGEAEDASVERAAAALGQLARRRRETGATLMLATVFPYSTHTFLMRRFLQLGGLDPDRDVRLTVVPPPFMADALRSGAVDGFCAGSPWNSVAVAAGWGRIVALGSELVPDAPEKLLAWPDGRLSEAEAASLVRALKAAADWCGDAANRPDLASLLSEPRHLGVDRGLVLRTLDGLLPLNAVGSVRSAPDYLKLGGETHRPTLEQGRWVYREMVRAGQLADDPSREAAAIAVYRPDLFDAYLGRVQPVATTPPSSA